MRKLTMFVAAALIFAGTRAYAEGFESWTDGMCVTPGTELSESITDIGENTRAVGVVLDGVLYSGKQNRFDFGKIGAGRHYAYIMSLTNSGLIKESGHISFIAASAANAASEDFDNYDSKTSKWKMNANAIKRSRPTNVDSEHKMAMRIKWAASDSPALMCQKLDIPDTADVTAAVDIMITDTAAKSTIFTTGLRGNSGSFDTESALTPAVLENCKIADVDIPVNEWIRIKYEFCVAKSRYRLFVNGQKAAEETISAGFEFDELRFDVSSTGSGYLYVDNASVDYADMSNAVCISDATFYTADGTAYSDMCEVPQGVQSLRLTLSRTGSLSANAPSLMYNGTPMYGFDYSYPSNSLAVITFPNGLKAGEYRLSLEDGRYVQTFYVKNDGGRVLYFDGEQLLGDIRGKTGVIYPGISTDESATPIFGVYNADGSLDSAVLSGGVNVGEGQRVKVFVWNTDGQLKPLADAHTDTSDSRVCIDSAAAENFTEISSSVTETGTAYLQDKTGFAEYFKDCICFIKDSKSFWFYGKKLELENVPECKDGKLYLSQTDLISLVGTAPAGRMAAAEYLCELTDMKASENGYMLLLSKSGEYLEESKSRALAMYLAMERPKAEWLSENISKTHPRVYANSEQMKKIFSSADARLAAVLKNAVDSADYSIGLIDGGRYEATNFSSPGNLWDYSYVLANYLAWRKTGDTKYKNAGIHMGLYTASFEHWSQDSSSLVTSSMIVTASYAYDLFYDEMTAQERDKIAKAIYENGIAPGYDYLLGNRTSINTWPIKTNNWNLICSSGVAVGAATLMRDYPQYDGVCAAALEAAVRSLEYGMTSFVPDGGGEEGASYLDYELYLGLIPYLECMDASYNTDFGLSEAPGFGESGYFMAYMNGADGKNFMYHDYNPSTYWAQYYEMMWFAAKYGDETLYNLAYELCRGSAPMLSKPMALFEKKTDGEYKKDKIFTRASVAVATGENAKLFMHAGDNNATHGQLDTGTFSYDFDGARFACDAGGGDYDDRYFSAPDEYYVNRAEAHNVYVIDPDLSGGQTRKAVTSITKIDTDSADREYAINMTSAYADKVYTAQRYFTLSKDRNLLCVRDEIMPVKDCSIKWFWNTDAAVTVIDGKTVRLYKNGKTLYLHFSSDAEFEITYAAAAPLDSSITKGASKIPNLKRIMVSFSAKAGEMTHFSVSADDNLQ